MSTSVESPTLAGVIARYSFAYLMTTNAKGAPHAVAVTAVLQGGELVVDGIGSRSRENALARPAVSLVWPPQTIADYSLIVDGRAAVTGESLRITPTRAVLHRPSASPVPSTRGTCGADCVELDPGMGTPERRRGQDGAVAASDVS